jgi:hypothetical protein
MPKLPLFDSGEPRLSVEISAQFGSGGCLPDYSPNTLQADDESIRRSVWLDRDLRVIRKAGSDAMVEVIRALDTIEPWGFLAHWAGQEWQANDRLAALRDDITIAVAQASMPTLREQFDHLDPMGEEL